MKIAIASGKGGTGKTTVSVNLSSLIAELNPNKNIILTDLDVEEPNSGLFLEGNLLNEEIKYRKVPVWQEENCIHCGKCKSVCNFNAIAQLPKMILVFNELCHSCYACSELCPMEALPMQDKRMGVLKHSQISSNLHFVEGKLDVGQESAVPLISQTKNYAKDKFQENSIFIYDAPPGASCPVIEAVKDVDFVILVTEPTPFGLHDLKLAIGTMQKMNHNIGVIINRSGIGNNDVENYCIDNNIQLIGKVPNMRQAAELYSEGKLLYKEIPEIKNELIKIFENIKNITLKQ